MNHLFSILVLFLFQQQLSAQGADQFKYKATYQLSFQPDSTDAESIKSENMHLYIGDRTSRFSSAGKAIGDSLKATLDGSNVDPASYMRMRKQIPSTEFEYYIYKGIPEGKMTYTREIFMDNYRYLQDKAPFNWTVLEETDTLAGYQVQKATTSFAGRDYTAWFTQEIPFSEGPYKFNGLPGLIVNIGDDKDHYVFELTQLQKLENPIPFIFQEEEAIETSQKKLLELEEEYKKDPVGFAERSVPGVKIEYHGEGDQQKIERARKEKLKKQNNPLELE